jgi:hypothetical protein
MAESAGGALRRPRRLLGLFEEAWHRQRRRRSWGAWIALSFLLAATLVVRDTRPRGGHDSPAVSPVVSQLSSAAVPASGHFAALAHIGGRLIVSGGPQGDPLDVSGAVTTLAHARATGLCSAASVVAGTVRVGPVHRANCGDPALYGLHVLPVMFNEHRSGHRGLLRIGVRIAVVDPGARDGYRLGPIVMSYAQCSDCGAQWIEGDGSLWINGSYVSPRHHGGLLLRVSTHTGQVLQSFVVPEFLSALLAVNQNGLWLAPSIETGSPPHLTRREQSKYESLYLIAPGASRPQQILRVRQTGADWLTAAGDRVWLEDRPTGATSQIITFTGTDPRDGRRAPRRKIGPGTEDEIGEGTVPYAASPHGGVDAILSPTNGQQQIININATTLAKHTVATIPYAGSYYVTPAAATQGTSAYFLDPRLSDADAVTPARLYRVNRP